MSARTTQLGQHKGKNMKLILQRDVAGKKAGDKVEIDDLTAQRWINAGHAIEDTEPAETTENTGSEGGEQSSGSRRGKAHKS